MTGDDSKYNDSPSDDEDFLEEVRDNYQTALESFRPSMDEGDEDINFILNDGWPEAEKALRRKPGSERPMVSCDQLNQYTNLVINEVRQHPRQIKISPAGYGATAKLAEIRENRLRSIQYRSDAQAAYLTAMENACQRSYAFARVTLRYVSEMSTDQEIIIQRIPNPNSVLFDPACREIDCSDADFCFVLETFTKKAFKRRWPKATIINFDSQMSTDYPEWIKDNHVQVAEYWKVLKRKDHLYIVSGGDGTQHKMLESEFKKLKGGVEEGVIVIPPTDEMPEGMRFPIASDRSTEIKKIVQYITNGVERLETNAWIGKWIPIVPLFGKEVYSSHSGQSKKVLMSLIRNARDPQRAYNYFMTCAMEAVGMVPRSTTKALEGSLEGYEKDWQEAHHIPKAWLYYKPVQLPDGTWATDPPGSTPFDPPLQNLMIGVEAFLRAIQSAVGMYNTSVGKDDTNAKSGVAIKQLDAQSDQGAFHFIDNYNHRFLGAIGRICNDLISKVDAGPRQVTVRTKDNKDQLIWVNKPYTDDDGVEQHHDMTLGEYDVTIGVEQTEDSQREAASDFLETFIDSATLANMDPVKRDALLALVIELKQLGPIAEQMVKILQPEQGDPAQVQQQLQQLQAQLTQLQTENAALLQDKAARVLEQQTKVKIEEMKQAGKGSADAAAHMSAERLAELQVWAKIIVAEMQKQSRSTDQIAEQDASRIEQALDHAHEVGTQAVEHEHERNLAAQNAQHAQDQATQAANLQPQSTEGQ
jgi:Phage P22-like portal protein